MASTPSTARVVVIGAGIVGNSLVHHLARLGWRDIVGDCGEIVSIDRFGASAPYQVIYEQLGLTPERVAAAAQRSLSNAGGITGAPTGS